MKTSIFTIILILALTESYSQNSWVQTNGPTGGSALCLYSNGAKIYAGTGDGIFYSSNSGLSWKQSTMHQSTCCMAISGNYLIAAPNIKGLFYSTNNGSSWASAGFNNIFVWSLVIKGSKIFAGTSGGLYCSTNDGQSWNIQPLINNQIKALSVFNNNLLAGTSDSGIYISPDDGQSWNHSSFRNQFVGSIVVNGPDIFTVANGGVFRSTDSGNSWSSVLNQPVRCLLINGTYMYAGTYVGNGSGILYSTDYGATWTTNTINYGQVYSIILSGTDIITSVNYYGILKSSNNGQSWFSLPFNNQNVWAINGSSSIIYAGSSEYGLARSTDLGMNWNRTINENLSISSVAATGEYVLVSPYGHQGLLRSTDFGQTWNQSMSNLLFNHVAMNDSFAYAGSSWGLLFSSNYGRSWKITGFKEADVYTFAFGSQKIFAGTNFKGIYISTDNGINWTQSVINNRTVYSIAAMNSNVIAATYNGVLCSSDNGTTWPLNTLNDKWVISVLIYDNVYIAGCRDSGIFVSSDFGNNWIPKNEGLGAQVINEIALVSDNVYIATQGSSVWKRAVSELVGVKSNNSLIANNFSLSQNYPNPFNPVTNIKFEIPVGNGRDRSVKLIVYDLLGKEITTLVNQQMQAGSYSVDWDASNYPSGVYFYKLESENFTESKKMVLIK